jgi:thymidylate kinase
MRNTQLVLFEGVPGAGKSSAAHAVDRQLTRLGRAHRWWYEEERRHPLATFDDAASMNALVEEIFAGRYENAVEKTLQKWRALAQSIAFSNEVVLLDGALFGHMTWTLFPADVPNDVTAA